MKTINTLLTTSTSTRRSAFNGMEDLMVLNNQIAARFSSHVTIPMQISPSFASQSELIASLNQVFKQQEQINLLQFQLSNTNYIGNLINLTTNNKLEAIIKHGVQELLNLSKTVDNLTSTLCDLNLDIESQRNEAIRLNDSLKDTQSILAKAIVSYRCELDEQKVVIERQGDQLNSLLRVRLRTALLIDSGLVAFILLFIRKSFLRSLLRTISKILPKRIQRNTEKSLEFFLFLALFVKVRHFFAAFGLQCSLRDYSLLGGWFVLPKKPFISRK